MKKSFRSRVGGAVVALALGATGLATVGAAPAHADNYQCTTATTLNVSKTAVTYGGDVNFSASAAIASCAGGSGTAFLSAAGGTMIIERSTDGVTWTPIYSEAGYHAFEYLSLPGSGWYHARFTGGTETATNPDKFAGSTSAAVRVDVYRKVDVRSRRGKRAKVTFVVSPAASIAGARATLQIKKGKKWKVYKRPRFKANGTATVFLTNTSHKRKGTPYRLIVPASSDFAGNVYSFRIVTTFL